MNDIRKLQFPSNAKVDVDDGFTAAANNRVVGGRKREIGIRSKAGNGQIVILDQPGYDPLTPMNYVRYKLIEIEMHNFAAKPTQPLRRPRSPSPLGPPCTSKSRVIRACPIGKHLQSYGAMLWKCTVSSIGPALAACTSVQPSDQPD